MSGSGKVMYRKENGCGDDKRKFFILLILHCIVAVFCVGYFVSEKQGRFYGEYMDSDSRYYSVYGVWDEERQGYYVDNSIGGGGLFTCGPYMELKKGIYNITIFYESTGSGNRCVAYAEDEVECYSDALYSDTIELDSDHTVKTFTIRNNRDCQDFEVQTYYGGDGSLLIKGVVISQGAEDSLFMILKILCVTALADLVFFFYYAKKKNMFSKKSILTGFALAGIICFASSPIFYGELFHYSTDLNFILMRIEGLKDGILSGAFPVRIQPNWINGYGYATSIFYGDLFLIIPAFLRIFGVSIQGAYFGYLICVNAATCLIAYFCFKRMFNVRHIAIIGSCVYTLSTFRLTLMYVLSRGGMYTAYTFLPLVAYGVYLIYYDYKNKKSWFCLSLGMTGILNSHILTSEITAFTLALVILFSVKRFFRGGGRVFAMLKAVGASVLINIGFLVPLFDYIGDMHVLSDSGKAIYNYIQKAGEDGSGFFVLFREGRSAWSPDLLLLLGICLFLIILVIIPSAKEEGIYQRYREIGIVTFAVSIILLFMGTKYFPWDIIEDVFPWSRRTINTLQFPYRFYEDATVLMTITLCCALMILKERMGKNDYRIGLTVTLCICLLSAEYIISDLVNHAPSVKIYDTEALDDNRICTEEYLPEGAEPELFIHETAVAEEGVDIISFQKDRLNIRMQCANESTQKRYIELPLVYYEGYRAQDGGGNRLTVSCGENKTVLLELPPGYLGDVFVFFQEPMLWTITFWVSVIGMIGLTAKVFMVNKKRND